MAVIRPFLLLQILQTYAVEEKGDGLSELTNDNRVCRVAPGFAGSAINFDYNLDNVIMDCYLFAYNL